jgi:hypothetical protein
MLIRFTPFSKRPSHTTLLTTLLLTGLALAANSVAADSSYPIAGVTPDARPVGAPTIKTVDKQKDWYKQALTGIDAPYPASLHFLENQGNWFIPFIRPGMLDRYDIRNWHK